MYVLKSKYHLEKSDRVAAIAGTVVLVAIIGWIYEVLFYWANSGFTTWYWRGAGFGPWIDIYGLGAILIMAMAGRFSKHPVIVFAVSGAVCGLLEYIAGALIFYTMDGKRPWNYNTEILNFGNIHGFVCLRSVLFFAAGGLLIMYVIVPVMVYLIRRFGKVCKIIFLIAAGLFILDYFYNSVLVNLFDSWMSAGEFYDQYLHFNFVTFTNGLLDG